MKTTAVKEAIDEAKRFLEKALPVVAANERQGTYDREQCYASVVNAACKRASMDLTRALARMRKP